MGHVLICGRKGEAVNEQIHFGVLGRIQFVIVEEKLVMKRNCLTHFQVSVDYSFMMMIEWWYLGTPLERIWDQRLVVPAPVPWADTQTDRQTDVHTLQPVVPRSLKVKRHEVHPGSVRWSFGEQASGDLFGEEVIVGLGGEITQTPDQPVHTATGCIVDVHRSSEGLQKEIKPCFLLSLLAVKPKDISGFN